MVPVVGGVGLALVLLALVVAAVTERGWQRFCFAYLVGFSFVLTVALGALFFVILQHLTRAGWSVVLRRLVEPQSDPFTWGRFAAEPDDTPRTLAAKLNGWYTPFRDAWLDVFRRPTSSAQASQ